MTCRILARAPADASYFFGFHDVSPWSPDDSRILLHRVDPALRHRPGPQDLARIVLWDPATGATETVGETTCWNFQQGARAMWLPGAAPVLAYNRRVGDAPGCEIVDLTTGVRRVLPHALGAVAPDGSHALAPNFARLGALWPAYGYAGFASAADAVAAPDDDGLWRIDLATGARRLLVSVADLATAAAVAPGTPLFVTHVSFNRAGTRIVFMMRFFSKDAALYSLLYTARPDGSGLRLLAQEKISHFDWTAEDEIVVWMRRSPGALAAARRSGLLAAPLVRPLVNLARRFRGRLKGAVLNESYVTLSVETGARRPFMPGILPQDGHPMLSPDGGRMIVDEYPDPTGRTPLRLVGMAGRTRTDIAVFQHEIGSADTDLKCDLHPRWNRAGTRVGVDATEGGRRRFAVLDLADLVGADLVGADLVGADLVGADLVGAV